MATTMKKPKLAVWKFASCDGCQLSLLDCEEELLAIAGNITIANFPEASRAIIKGPYDISRRGIDYDVARCRAHSRHPSVFKALDCYRRLRHRGRYPGAA